MLDIEDGSPEQVLNKTDPGDDMQRRVRYQDTYAAIISISLLDEESDVQEVYCEHHEDIFVKRKDGSYSGIQVKTRQPGQSPFKAVDEEIVSSLCRFIKLEKDYSKHFSNYIIVSNCGFWTEKRNLSNIDYLLKLAKLENPTSQSTLASFLKKISKKSSCGEEVVLQVLIKANLSVSSGLDDIQERLIKTIKSVAQVGTRRYDDLERAAKALVQVAFQASSLSNSSPIHSYFAALADPVKAQTAAVIQEKLITKAMVLKTIEAAFSDITLIRSRNRVPLSELPEGMLKLETKMAAGGIPVSDIDLAKDHKFAAEKLFAEWIYRYDRETANRYYEHIRAIANTESQEAYSAEKSQDKLFGEKMLATVRQRLRSRQEKERESLLGCQYEHLMGTVGILTEECKVWWSESFEIPEGQK